MKTFELTNQELITIDGGLTIAADENGNPINPPSGPFPTFPFPFPVPVPFPFGG